MRIGWLCEGLYTRNGTAADGGANHRIPVMAQLISEGHQIIFYSNKYRKYYDAEENCRNDELLVRKNIVLNTEQYKLFSEYVTEDYEEIRKTGNIKKFSEFDFDNIDILMVEPNGMFLGLLAMCSLVKCFDVPVFYQDIDNLYKSFSSTLKKLNYDDSKITYCLNYNAGGKNVITSFFPYNEEDELNVIPLAEKKYHLMYIGNDYRRLEKMLMFYDFPLHTMIYGKYSAESMAKFKNAKFGGKLEFSKVMEEYAKAMAAINIIRNDYEKLGNFTYRTVELAQAGIYQFVDSEIKDTYRFFNAECLVNSVTFKEKIKQLPNNYEAKVLEQRALIKSKVPTIKQFADMIIGVK